MARIHASDGDRHEQAMPGGRPSEHWLRHPAWMGKSHLTVCIRVLMCLSDGARYPPRFYVSLDEMNSDRVAAGYPPIPPYMEPPPPQLRAAAPAVAAQPAAAAAAAHHPPAVAHPPAAAHPPDAAQPPAVAHGLAGHPLANIAEQEVAGGPPPPAALLVHGAVAPPAADASGAAIPVAAGSGVVDAEPLEGQ